MKKVLITGGRAPATLELIRILSKNNFQVYLAESILFPLSKFSKYTQKSFKIHSPKFQEKQFINDLICIIKKEKIDLLIPTCEEIFYISKNLSSFDNCQVLCQDFNTLNILHNKWNFFQFLQNHFPQLAPNTQIIFKADQLNSNNSVFKPIYSRFASRTLIKPSNAEKIPLNGSWLKQEYISGIEYSSYSFAFEGELKAHTCYYSKYKAGSGAGIYFEYCKKNNIQNFVEKIVKILNFTGHISFDYIENEQKEIKVLECNPRLTSGIHFFHNINLSNKANQILEPINTQNNMLILAMLLYKHFPYNAKEIIFSMQDFLPCIGQLLSFTELIGLSLKHKISLLEATTYDLEYNG